MAYRKEKTVFACTYEFLFYNENYQAGVYIAYEFLITNSGGVEKYKIVHPFWESKYRNDYRILSKFEKVIHMGMDLVYVLGVLIITGSMLKTYYVRIRAYFKYKLVIFYWFEVIDSLVIIFSIITLSYWAKLIVFTKPI